MEKTSELSKGTVFISYRRDSGVYIARMMLVELEKRGYNVFFDIEKLGPGEFDKNLLKKIENSDHFVLILSKDSLNRCVNDGDYVRMEIRHALEKGINIVPVMVDGVQFPNELPADIDGIRKFNSVALTNAYFDACIDRMEMFFATAQKQKEEASKAIAEEVRKSVKPSKVKVQKEETNSILPKKVNKLVSGVITTLIVMIVISAAAFWGNREEIDNQENETVKQAVDGSSISSYGNISGNLCNKGYACYRGASASETTDLVFVNKLENGNIFWYDSLKNQIMGMMEDKESQILLEQKDVGYLLVMPEYFYYTVGSGTADTLYRAVCVDGLLMGEAEELIAGISRESNLIVEDNQVYFMKEGTGILHYDIENNVETILLEEESTWRYKIVGFQNGWLYIQDEECIWRVNTQNCVKEELLHAKELLGDYLFTNANVNGSWIYFSVSDAEKDTVKQVDCVYRIRLDGTQMNRLFTAESYDHTIHAMNLYFWDEEILFTSVLSGNELCVYNVSIDEAKVTKIANPKFNGFTDELLLDDGNTIGNLCNLGFICSDEDENATYIGGINKKYYNRYCKDYGFYYAFETNDIVLAYTTGDKIQTKTLLENVDCSYLYVNPEWVYYVIDQSGVSNLYRAENQCMDYAIGESQLLATGICDLNSIAIHNGKVYYWQEENGLCSMKADGRDIEVLYPEAYNGHHTYDVTDEYVYFYTNNKMYKVSIADKRLEWELDGSSYFEDGKIVSAIREKDKTFIAIHYGDEAKPDEIWEMGSGNTPKLLMTSPALEYEILGINIVDNYVYLWFDMDGETKTASFLSDKPDELKFY